jgi:hypothetical protein
MLDDEERSVLDETERALVQDDPDLVRRMRRARLGDRRRGRSGGRRRLHVVAVAAAVVLVGGLLLLGLPGQALLVALFVIALLVLSGSQPSHWIPMSWRIGRGPRDS